ncbi:GspH/FimT family pseudopilin [Teredinibacter purpureus]|uniref:GspH/FimT family pseudopilin n=1 Tax=Teredinibacter purpureus TaxID=2731756 RepID=UPI0009E39B50|nr:GspH/FimT family pseudopilin [Teredinibacter purpureus]
MFVVSRQKGLTIPELMIGIALLAILTSFAVPSFTGLMRRQELNAQLSLLTSTLAFVRNEAVTRQENIVFCGSPNGSSCTSGTDWSDGWLVYVDTDDDNILDPSEIVLRRGGESGGRSTLNVVTATPQVIKYNSSGEAGIGVSTVYLCSGSAISGADTDKSRTLSVSNVGSVRVAMGATCP